MSNYVPGCGSSSAKLMIVGEAPGYHEDQLKQPLVGPTGQLTRELVEATGMSWAETYRSNVHKYRPPDNKLSRYSELGIDEKEELRVLWNEINEIKPNCILALGDLALRTLTGKSGITKYRGSILESINGYPKVVGTFHPARLLYQSDEENIFDARALPYSARQYVQADFRRAVAESATKALDLPRRLLTVARNSHDVYSFLYENSDKDIVSIDIEAMHCAPTCIGLAFSKHRAISIPIINLDLKGAVKISDGEMDDIWIQLSKLLNKPGLRIIGQNFKYDHEKLIQIGLMEHRDIYADTMAMSRTAFPELPASLAFLTSIHTREPYYKDEYQEFDPKKHSLDRVYLYNAKDAAVTFEVWEALDKIIGSYSLTEYFYDYRMRLHRAYLEMESIGFRVDRDKKGELAEKYISALKELEKIVYAAAGCEFNVRSPKQVAEVMYNHLGLPRRADTGEDTIVALIANHCNGDKKKETVLQGILDLRRINKTLGTYLAAPADFDGRMRTNYRIFGTETGRSSTSNLEAPLRPFIYFGKKKKAPGLAFQTMTKHGDVGADIRSMFIADEGFEFLEVDMSQAEARIVALLAKDDELLKLFDTVDVHSMTAGWFFNIAPEFVSKEMRFIGKTGRHGGNYDMRKRRLMLTINTDAKKFKINTSVSEWRAGQILEIFHKFSPKIRSIFHQEIQETLRENNRILIGPYGFRRQFMDRWGDELFKEAYATIPQNTVRDHVGHSLLRIKDRMPAIQVVLESHDSLLFQTPRGETQDVAKAIKATFEVPISFESCSLKRGELLIPVEFQRGDNYKEMVKYAV